VGAVPAKREQVGVDGRRHVDQAAAGRRLPLDEAHTLEAADDTRGPARPGEGRVGRVDAAVDDRDGHAGAVEADAVGADQGLLGLTAAGRDRAGAGEELDGVVALDVGHAGQPADRTHLCRGAGGGDHADAPEAGDLGEPGLPDGRPGGGEVGAVHEHGHGHRVRHRAEGPGERRRQRRERRRRHRGDVHDGHERGGKHRKTK
jgi:hypothetical protein